MTGERVKWIIGNSGFSQKELSEKMPTIKYEQDWTRILKSGDVKSGLLEEMAAVMGISVGELYEMSPDQNQGEDITVDEMMSLIKSKSAHIVRLQSEMQQLIGQLGQKLVRK